MKESAPLARSEFSALKIFFNVPLAVFLLAIWGRSLWILNGEGADSEGAWLVLVQSLGESVRPLILVSMVGSILVVGVVLGIPWLERCLSGVVSSVVLIVLTLFSVVLPFVDSWVRDSAFRDETEISGIYTPRNLAIDSLDCLPMDVDGDEDIDLLVNHRHLHPPSFFVNRGDGTFLEEADPFGLYDNASVGGLFGIPKGGVEGCRLWHDWPDGLDEQGSWHLRWDAGEAIRGTLRTTNPFQSISWSSKSCRAEIREEGKVVEFSSDGRAGGLDIEQETLVGSYQLELEGLGIRKLRIGHKGRTPTSLPLSFDVTDRHGAVAADFDRDQDLDLFVTCGARNGQIKPPDPGKEDLLYLNDQGRRFERVHNVMGESDRYARGRSAAWVDLYGDGDPELYVSSFKGPNRLYGFREGRFVEETPEPLALTDRALFEFVDVDRDGDLDFFALRPLTLLRHEQGTFVHVKDRMGLPEFPLPENHGLFPESAFAFEDWDDDGDLDLFLDGRLYRQDGAKFVEDSSFVVDGRVVSFAFGDYDNDGDRDLAVARATGRNLLLENDGGKFRNVTRKEGVSVSRQVGVACAFFDANGDGALDLFTIQRTLPSIWDRLFSELGYHRLFVNQGNDNHWIAFELFDEAGHRILSKATVRVETSEGVQIRDVGLSERIRYSRGVTPLHFGLGKHGFADSVEIVWPNGAKQVLQQVQGDQIVTVKQEKG